MKLHCALIACYLCKCVISAAVCRSWARECSVSLIVAFCICAHKCCNTGIMLQYTHCLQWIRVFRTVLRLDGIMPSWMVTLSLLTKHSFRGNLSLCHTPFVPVMKACCICRYTIVASSYVFFIIIIIILLAYRRKCAKRTTILLRCVHFTCAPALFVCVWFKPWALRFSPGGGSWRFEPGSCGSPTKLVAEVMRVRWHLCARCESHIYLYISCLWHPRNLIAFKGFLPFVLSFSPHSVQNVF